MRSNEKWIALSVKLRAAGWQEDLIRPHMLESQYHAGKGVLRESKEKVGDREIFVFATAWFTGEEKKYGARLWFRNVGDLQEHLAATLGELIKKIPLRTALSVVSIDIEDREATHHPVMVQIERGGNLYPEDFDWSSY